MSDELGKIIQSHLHTVKVPAKYTMGSTHPYAGRCYVASEAYYHLSPDWLQPYYSKYAGTTHWFLKNPIDDVIDLTIKQFSEGSLLYKWITENYGAATPAAFLTKQPSKRAQALIDLVLEDIV